MLEKKSATGQKQDGNSFMCGNDRLTGLGV